MQFPYFYFGARYHPEWYPHDAALLEEDAALMKSLHMNAVIISASAVHYVIGLGGGYSWLSGIISRLGENGIDSVVEVPDPLPPVDILRRLNEDGFVRFFMVCSEKAGKALQTIPLYGLNGHSFADHYSKAATIKKPRLMYYEV